MAKRGSKSSFSAPPADAVNPIDRKVESAPQPDGPARHSGPPGPGVAGFLGRVISRALVHSEVTLYGTRRLRKLLKLSDHCDIEQVCDDAAAEIARLQKSLSDRPFHTRRRDEF